MVFQVHSSTDLARLRGPSFGCLNVRSLVRKIDDIRLLLYRSKLNCLCLTESWLNNSISDEEMQIPNYKIVRLDRGNGSSKKGGGGLVAYVDLKYDYQHIVDWNLCNGDIEIMWLKLRLKLTRPTYNGLVYHPPSGNVENFCEIFEQKCLDIQSSMNCDLLVMGDINIDTKKTTDSNTKRYLNMCRHLNLGHLIKHPTRVTQTSQTCIDHLLTDRGLYYQNAGSIDLGLSDHCLIYVSRKKSKISRSIKYIDCRSYTSFEPLKFQESIGKIDWAPVLNCEDSNLAAAIL